MNYIKVEYLINIFSKKRIDLDDDRQLIQHLVNEYLLEGSNDVLDLIRNCPNECFEVPIKFYALKLFKSLNLGTC
jgi:hypothetical protein